MYDIQNCMEVCQDGRGGGGLPNGHLVLWHHGQRAGPGWWVGWSLPISHPYAPAYCPRHGNLDFKKGPGTSFSQPTGTSGSNIVGGSCHGQQHADPTPHSKVHRDKSELIGRKHWHFVRVT